MSGWATSCRCSDRIFGSSWLGGETVYQTPVAERLPAFCLAVDLADEMKFREQVVAPLERLVSAIVLSIGAQVRPMEYHGAQLMTIRFAETEHLRRAGTAGDLQLQSRVDDRRRALHRRFDRRNRSRRRWTN